MRCIFNNFTVCLRTEYKYCNILLYLNTIPVLRDTPGVP